MKKYLTLILLALVTTSAHANFWDNCTANGGTIITANSYGNDKGGLCNDPNDASLSKNCNGKSFCRSKDNMNWWSAFTWCESVGGKLASFESMCPDTQKMPGPIGFCANFGKRNLGYWGISNAGWGTGDFLRVSLNDGLVTSAARSVANQITVAVCEE